MTLWWCRAGHTIEIPDGVEVCGAWCPKEGHKGSNEMKPRDLFPSWGPAEPPESESRRCCKSYRDVPHLASCRFALAPWIPVAPVSPVTSDWDQMTKGRA